MPDPGGGSVNPFGCTEGIGCRGRPVVRVLVGVGVGLGGSVVATTLGVGIRVPPGGDTKLQAARHASRSSPTKQYARRLDRSDGAVTSRAYVDLAVSEPPPDRDSYARRAPQTVAREHGPTCPVALIRMTTESAGT
jgi:hypothetical protein